MLRLPLLALLALPLLAEPVYTLYDCTDRTAICEGAFPGERAVRVNPAPFRVGGRLVVDGRDLGAARTPGAVGEESFDVLYRRNSWVIGWRYCCDQDEDGWLVKWNLAGNTEFFDYPELQGDMPLNLDVNGSGMIFGFARNSDHTPLYDTNTLNISPESVAIPRQFLREDGAFNQTPFKMMRINDAGQALFSAVPSFGEGPETLFLFSPTEVPFPVHHPEPATWLMMVGGVGALVRGRRRLS